MTCVAGVFITGMQYHGLINLLSATPLGVIIYMYPAYMFRVLPAWNPCSLNFQELSREN